MANQADLRYTREHEWARVEGERTRVGIKLMSTAECEKYRQTAGGH